MSGAWTGCYYCKARLGPGLRRCSKCGARKCPECGACFCDPDFQPRDYQRYFWQSVKKSLAIWEVEGGKGQGDLYALMKVEPDESGGDIAVIMNKRGGRFRVSMDYLQERCFCLTKTH